MLGTVGFLLAIIVNVDAVRIAHTFYVDEPVRQAVVAQATADRNCAAMPGARMRARGGGRPSRCGPELLAQLGRCFPGVDVERATRRISRTRVVGWSPDSGRQDDG